MKNKRKEHSQIIENFQENSQQAEVIRHDLIDTHEVSHKKNQIIFVPENEKKKHSKD